MSLCTFPLCGVIQGPHGAPVLAHKEFEVNSEEGGNPLRVHQDKNFYDLTFFALDYSNK